MPKKMQVSRAAHATDLMPEHPKPWTEKQPRGLHVLDKAIGKKTATDVWKFFHTKDFPWIQRFGQQYPKTAHHNLWRSGAFVGDEQQKKFAAEHPAIHAMCEEAVAAMNEHLSTKEPNSSFRGFRAESVNVHLHKPNWGLGAHYDDATDIGSGMVLMVSIGNEGTFPKETRKPRVFRFTDPVRGRQFDVDTHCRQIILFKDDAYDFWRHESVREKKQTGDCLSFTIRMHDCDGHLNVFDSGPYPRGAPAAAKIAHKRLRAKLGPVRVARYIAAAAAAQEVTAAKKAERAAKKAAKA